VSDLLTAGSGARRVSGGGVGPTGRRGGQKAGRSLLRRPLTPYYLLLCTTGLLLALGLMMVLSASSITAYTSLGSPFAIFVKQLMWAAIGLPLIALGASCPPRAMRRLGYPLLCLSAFGLVAVLIPGIGSAAGGASRWIALGSVRFQPSEPAKLALVLWGADLLARKERLLNQPKHLLLPLLPVGLSLAGLVLAEPDMGTMMVVTSVLFGLLFVVGAPRSILGTLAASAGVAGVFLAVAAPYRIARLTSFVNPFADPSGTGYQAVQGLYALAGGGWFGVGLGASRQKWSYLPNAYTDYIYAIIGEELGLAGACTVLVLFCCLGYAGIRIAQEAPDRFSQLTAAGITIWLLTQALLNMGAVTGLLPITGIPLPLISFGGSSLAVTLFAIGLLLSIARRSHSAPALNSSQSRRPGLSRR